MTATATPTTEVLPAAAEPASHEPDDVEYPEGQWIAQSVWHGDAVRLATTASNHHLRDREDVLVVMELVVYYRRGDNTAWPQPDVQVVLGAGRGGDRVTYKVWEEGQAPDLVLEVASPSPAGNDARYKAGEYAGIGVREYWQLDPKGSLMARPLEGYEVAGGRYRPVAAVRRGGRGDGAGVPQPTDRRRVRRRAGGGRAASAGRGEARKCCRESSAPRRGPEARYGGAGAGNGGATPESHCTHPSVRARFPRVSLP